MGSRVHRLWLVHLAVGLLIAVFFALPFATITLTSGSFGDPSSAVVKHEVSATLLGRGTSTAAGGPGTLQGTSLTVAGALAVVDGVTRPLDLAFALHLAAVLVFLGLIRTRSGAVLAGTGAFAGLAMAMWMRLTIGARASDAARVLGDGFGVEFGLGSYLVPVAFALAMGWSVIRLVAPGRGEAEVSSPGPIEPVVASEALRGIPTVVRVVGWILVGFGALGVLTVATLEGAREADQLVWRIPAIAVYLATGAGLVAGRRWAFVAGLVIGGISALWSVWVILSVAMAAGGERVTGALSLFVPMAILFLIPVVPFALLLRSDSRTWFAGRPRGDRADPIPGKVARRGPSPHETDVGAGRE